MRNIFILVFFLNYFIVLSQSKDTEVWEPIPEKVNTYDDNLPPSDAIILFDGTDFSNWVTWGDKEPQWIINDDGSMTVVNGKGSIFTKESF